MLPAKARGRLRRPDSCCSPATWSAADRRTDTATEAGDGGQPAPGRHRLSLDEAPAFPSNLIFRPAPLPRPIRKRVCAFRRPPGTDPQPPRQRGVGLILRNRARNGRRVGHPSIARTHARTHPRNIPGGLKSKKPSSPAPAPASSTKRVGLWTCSSSFRFCFAAAEAARALQSGSS